MAPIQPSHLAPLQPTTDVICYPQEKEKQMEDSHVSDISDGTKSSCYPQSQALDSSQALVEPSHLAPLQPTTDVIRYPQGKEQQQIQDSHVSDISDGTKSSCYPQSQALDSSQALVEPSHLAPLQPTTDVIHYPQGKEQQQIQDSHVSDISDGTKLSCYPQSQALDLSQAPLQPSTNKDPLIGGGGVDHNLSFEIQESRIN